MHGRKSRRGAPFQSTFAPDNGINSNIYIIIINERIMSIKIKVNGMSCAHCKDRVEKGLAQLSGVKAVRVDLKAGTAEVEGDVTEDTLRTAIDDLGYAYGGHV